MKKWFMVTVVGKDRPGIVAHISEALYQGGCQLGEASMMRLGGNFTIMLMVEHDTEAKTLSELLEAPADALGLRIHVDEIEGHLHEHLFPDVSVMVHGADRLGIVAQVTHVLAEAGLNILDLESDVAGTEQEPIYIMHVEGVAAKGIETLELALDSLVTEGIEVRLTPIDTMIA
ncbi:MAG TPA: ACT domain-containing protein [Acidiferrobacteraceae bacterium]|nr:ACT domain-containing protein [Acidiferrobacteraceae bacterium]